IDRGAGHHHRRWRRESDRRQGGRGSGRRGGAGAAVAAVGFRWRSAGPGPEPQPGRAGVAAEVQRLSAFRRPGVDPRGPGGGGCGVIKSAEAFQALAYRGDDGMLAQLLSNNNDNMNGLLRFNSRELAFTQELTHSDLAAAGAALRSGDIGTAAQQLGNAVLINAGTTLDVGARTVFGLPLMAGQDLDILGGGASLIGGRMATEAAAAVAGFTGVAPGDLLGNLQSYNHDALASLQSFNASQLSAVQALTRADLAAAGTSLGSGDIGGAVRHVADAGLVNAGMAMTLGSRDAGFAFQLAGQDLNILGGNDGFMRSADAFQALAVARGDDGMLAQLLSNNNSN